MNLIPLRGAASRRRLAAACAAFASSFAIAAPGAHTSDARPGPEAFFQNPAMTGARISPDGRTVAVTLSASPAQRVRLLAIDVATLKPTVLAQFADTDIGDFHWINDHRLVFDLDDRQAAVGELHASSGLFAVNIDGTYYRQLINRYLAALVHGPGEKETLPWYTEYLRPAGEGHDPDEIYVGQPGRRDDSGTNDMRLHLLNTVTRRVKDIETPIGAEGWVFDAAGEPRVTTVIKDDREKLMLRDVATGRWKTIADFELFGTVDGMQPLVFDENNQLFVTATQGHDTRSVYTWELAAGKVSDQPWLKSDRYDLAPVFLKKGNRLVGVRYQIDAEVTKWMDPDMAAMQARVDALLPATINRLSVAEHGDGHYAVVVAYSDRVPSLFYLYDAHQDKLIALGQSHPEVDPDKMSRMEPVHYAARDGLQIPAWLTLPQGAARKDLPLVVLVHGGPYVRGEYWHWNPEVQFLAARGYAVLEPEFRGSTGFGSRLFRAGWKQWGLAMQNDVADGVKWAVEQGIVDPKRVCIAGASYGGYAVLMGLINDPQVYRCGVDWVGVTDIDLLYTAHWSDLPTIWKDYGMPRLVGDRVADAAQLKATSPLRNVDKIHAPLLLAYGGKDQRVPKVHGEDFRDALMKQPGADLQWVLYDQEGHGWRSLDTRIDFWNRTATFLDKNLAPR